MLKSDSEEHLAYIFCNSLAVTIMSLALMPPLPQH